MIILSAWVLWLETYSPKGTEREPKGGYPDSGYEACMADARANIARLLKWYTEAKFKGVSQYSDRGSVSIMAELKPREYYHWTYRCLPDTVDPRGKP
jgi:hypothetical protein